MDLLTILSDICEKNKYEKQMYSVEFRPSRISPISLIDYMKTRKLYALMEITNKITQEKVVQEVNMLDVPINDGFGFENKNNTMQYTDEYVSTSGWYLTEDKGKTVLRFKPDSGRYFTIYKSIDGYFIEFKNPNGSDKKIPLINYLKFISDYSNEELLDALGRTEETSLILTSNISLQEAMDSVRNVIGSTQKNVTTESLSDFEKINSISDIRDRLFSQTFTKLGAMSRERAKKQFSYSLRASNATLADRLVFDVDGEKYEFEKGRDLSQDDLKLLDKSDVNTLSIIHNNKVIEVKKYPISDTLTKEEIFMGINRYLCYLSGLGELDDPNSVQNKTVKTYDSRVRDYLQRSFNYLKSNIDSALKDLAEHCKTETLYKTADTIKGVNTKLLIEEFKSAENTSTQYKDSINALDLISSSEKYKTDIGKNTNIEEIAVQLSQRNFLNTIESPESDKSGKVLQKNLFTEVNESGELQVPFIKVVNGELKEENKVLLTSNEIFNHYVGEWDCDLSDPNKKVIATYHDELTSIEARKITYVRYSPYSDLATASCLVPFIGFSNPKRPLMQSNHIKQAFQVVNGESPIVLSGGEGLIKYEQFGMSITAKSILEDFAKENPALLNDIENFSKCEFILKSTKIAVNTRILFLEVNYKGETYFIEKHIPFLRKTVDSNMISYRINIKQGNKYSGDDIVAYEQSVGVSDRNIEKHLKLGSMKVSDDMFKYSIATGKNLLVMFGTIGSTNIDDAMTIVDEVQYDYSLSHVYIHKVEHVLKNTTRLKYSNTNKDIIEEKPYTPIDTVDSKIQHIDNGMPKVGTKIKPGDVIFMYNRYKNGSITGDLKREFAPPTVEGQVVSSYIYEDEKRGSIMTCCISHLAPIECGDKLCGRYGNKGIVSKIKKSEDMPFLKRNGKIIQVSLNPLGIPSRMNISQILETEISKSFAFGKGSDEKLGEDAICISSFNDETVDIILKNSKKYGFKMEEVIDGETGLPKDRPMQVGYMYMYKLKHIVNKKINSTGFSNNINPTTGQPKQGAGGGQSFSEYEHWCLEASGCTNILQTLQTVQSNSPQLEDLELAIKRNPYVVDVEGENVNNNYFKILPMLLQQDVETIELEDSNMNVFKPLTDLKLKNLSKGKVGNLDSLHSKTIFGERRNSKVINNNLRDNWGHLELNCKIINPFILYNSIVPKLIPCKLVEPKKHRDVVLTEETAMGSSFPVNNSVTSGLKTIGSSLGNTRIVDLLLANKLYLDIINVVTDTNHYKMVFISKDPSILENPKTGMKALTYVFEEYTIEDSKYFYRLAMNQKSLSVENKTDTKYLDDRLEKYIKYLTALENLSSYQIAFSDYIVSTYPVLPMIFRGEELGGEMEHSFDKYYKDLILSTISGQVNEAEIFYKIVDLVGLSPESVKNKKYQPFIKTFYGKGKDEKGLSRTAILAKRVHGSARSTITPISDSRRKITQLGVPFLIAINTWGLHLETIFTKDGGEFGGQFPLKVDRKHISELLKYVATDDIDGFESVFHQSTTGNIINKYGTDYLLKVLVEGIKQANKTYLDSCGDVNIEEDVCCEFANKFLELADTVKDFKSLFHAVRKVIVDFCSIQVVGFGRQPSLHKFAIRSYRPVLINSKPFEIHPLVCKGYNADFDGDQMYMIAFYLLRDQIEALEKLSPVDSIVNPKDGSPIIELVQDMLLGLYILCTLYRNETDIYNCPEYFINKGARKKQHEGPIRTLEDQRLYLKGMKSNDVDLNITYFSSVKELQVMLDTKHILPYDLACVQHNGNYYLSTAGRIRFNMCLPDGFTDETFDNPLNLPIKNPDSFCRLKYDGLIANKENKNVKNFKYYSANKITTSYFYDKRYSHEEVAEIIQELMELGLQYSESSGMSLGIHDIKSDARVENYIQFTNMSVDGIDEAYKLGLVSEKSKKKIEQQKYTELAKFTQESIMNVLDRNNNLFIIADSGARGNASQINQTIGVIGMTMRTLTTSLDKPILSAYGRGLNAMEYFQSTFGARMGIASAQDKTKDAGYATRQGAFMVAGFSVKEDDCGTKDNVLELKYKEPSRLVKIVEEDGVDTEVDIIVNSNGDEITVEDIKNRCKSYIEMFENLDKKPELIIYEELRNYYQKMSNSTSIDSSNKNTYLELLKNLDKIPPESETEEVNKYKEDNLLKEDLVFETQSIRAVGAYYYLTKPDLKISVRTKFFKLVQSSMSANSEWSELDIISYFSKSKSIPVLEGAESYIYRYNKEKPIEELFRNHINNFEIDGQRYKLYYKLDSMYANLLEYRVTDDLSLKGLKEESYISSTGERVTKHIITSETIKYIEDNNIREVKVRNILGCKTFGGVCKECYGLKFDSKVFPEIGDKVGFESAQAIGEPAAQLSISLINQGGIAGTSVASGVDILKAILRGGLPKNANISKVSQSTCYASVKVPIENGKYKIDLNGIVDRTDLSGFIDPESPNSNTTKLITDGFTTNSTNNLLISDGQYIRVGEQITAGIYDFKTMDSVITKRALAEDDKKLLRVLIRRKQLAMLETYFNTYSSNDIDIYARHFELLAKCQNNIATVVKSDVDKYKAGGKYEIREILDFLEENPDKKVLFNFRTAKQKEVVAHYSGTEACMLFERTIEVMSDQIGKTISKENLSMQSRVATGTNINADKLRVLQDKKSFVNNNIKKKDKVKTETSTLDNISVGDFLSVTDYDYSSEDFEEDISIFDNLDLEEEDGSVESEALITVNEDKETDEKVNNPEVEDKEKVDIHNDENEEADDSLGRLNLFR